jgi:hypothetical protein
MKYQLEALAGLFKGCACDRGLIKSLRLETISQSVVAAIKID